MAGREKRPQSKFSPTGTIVRSVNIIVPDLYSTTRKVQSFWTTCDTFTSYMISLKIPEGGGGANYIS
jgi:hypothetical protein